MPKNYTHSVLFCISTIEVGLSFVAACAPSFKPLIARFVPKLFGSSTRSNRYYNDSTCRSGRDRLGYKLEDMSRIVQRTHNQNITLVEAGDGQLDYRPTKTNAQNMITMTTEMKVTWDHSNYEEQPTGSTESLVHEK
jgi:hypothetical protein